LLGQAANQGKNHKGGQKKTWEQILILRQDNKREYAYRLRRGLIESGREYKCENPGCLIQDNWLGNTITLHVDHKNGNWRDNRSENIRFLCPNCHSQTDNYGNSKGYTDRTSSSKGQRERRKLKNALLLLNNGDRRVVYKEKRCTCSQCNNPLTDRSQDTYCSQQCFRLASRKVKRPSQEDLVRMIWSKPTSQLAKDFGVSDKAIEKWCKAYGIEKPPRGYWAKKQYGKL
jgi:Zn finger protein HypA/HybF involved in hydrogenase expression